MDMHLDESGHDLHSTMELVFVDYTLKDPAKGAEDTLCSTAWLTDQTSAHKVINPHGGCYIMRVNPANPHEAVHERWVGNLQGETWLHSSVRWEVSYMPKATIFLVNLYDDMVHSGPTESALDGVEDRVFLQVPVPDDTLRYMCAWAQVQPRTAQSNAQRAELERLYATTLLSRLQDVFPERWSMLEFEEAFEDVKAFKEKWDLCIPRSGRPVEDNREEEVGPSQITPARA